MTDIELHPDRLFPTDPGVRSIARRLYDEVRELPIISPHGHVDPAIAGRGRAVRRPGQPAHRTRPLRHPAAARHGRAARRPRRRAPDAPTGEPTPARDLADVLRALAPVPRHPVAATGWSRAGRRLRHRRPGRPPTTADAVYDQIADRLARPEFRPRALFERFGIEVLATTDDPLRRPRRPPAAGRTTRRGRAGSSPPSARTATSTGRGRAGPRGWTRLGEVTGEDTGDYAGYLAALEQRRAYFMRHGATATDHGHADARTEPLEPAEASRIYAARSPARPRAGRGRRRSAGTCSWSSPGCPPRTAWSCSCTRACCATTTPATFDRYGRDVGGDIPMTTEYTDALRPLLRALRHPPGLPAGALHRRRDDLHPRDRAAGGLLPAVLARRAVVVPRPPDAHAPVPGGGHRDGRLLQHGRLRRRHPRLLLDPGTPRRGPPGRLRVTSPGWSPSTGCPRTRRPTPPPTSRTGCPPRPSASHERADEGGGRRRRPGSGPGRPPRPRRLLPGAPGRGTPPGERRWRNPPASRRSPAGGPTPPGRSRTRTGSTTCWSATPTATGPSWSPACPGRTTVPTRSCVTARSLTRPSARSPSPSPRRATSGPPTARRPGRPAARRRRGALRADATPPVSTAPAGCCPGMPRAGRPTPARSPSSPATTWWTTGPRSSGCSPSSRRGRPGPRRVGRANVSFVSTMVDRITPRTTREDRRGARFHRQVQRPGAGGHRTVHRVGARRRLPGRRPAWEAAGAPVRRRRHRRSSSASCGAERRPLPARVRGPAAAAGPWRRRRRTRCAGLGGRLVGRRRRGTWSLARRDITKYRARPAGRFANAAHPARAAQIAWTARGSCRSGYCRC